MATAERRSPATHEVFNQASPLEDYNPFDADRPLQEALKREGAGWAEDRARELGAICGSAQTIRWGFEANEKKPQLKTHVCRSTKIGDGTLAFPNKSDCTSISRL